MLYSSPFSQTHSHRHTQACTHTCTCMHAHPHIEIRILFGNPEQFGNKNPQLAVISCFLRQFLEANTDSYHLLNADEEPGFLPLNVQSNSLRWVFIMLISQMRMLQLRDIKNTLPPSPWLVNDKAEIQFHVSLTESSGLPSVFKLKSPSDLALRYFYWGLKIDLSVLSVLFHQMLLKITTFNPNIGSRLNSDKSLYISHLVLNSLYFLYIFITLKGL